MRGVADFGQMQALALWVWQEIDEKGLPVLGGMHFAFWPSFKFWHFREPLLANETPTS
tara:strand:- start:245 stop:418 length:174 start_codon:yes stop_codon:yes gene_type:complete